MCVFSKWLLSFQLNQQQLGNNFFCFFHFILYSKFDCDLNCENGRKAKMNKNTPSRQNGAATKKSIRYENSSKWLANGSGYGSKVLLSIIWYANTHMKIEERIGKSHFILWKIPIMKIPLFTMNTGFPLIRVHSNCSLAQWRFILLYIVCQQQAQYENINERTKFAHGTTHISAWHTNRSHYRAKKWYEAA